MIKKEQLKKEYIILIAEDEIVNQKILEKLIKNLFKEIKLNLIFVKNKIDFKKVINKLKNKIDLILMDYELEDSTGIELTNEVKKIKGFEYVPVVFITGAYEEELLEKAFKAGAVEFMHKPYKKTELFSRLYNQLKMKKLIDQLEKIANYDTMTNIYNRRKFFQESESIFYENDNVYSVMFDLDKFKSVNDTYGHDIGDLVIQKFASILKSLQPNNSIIGRYGGEEFVMLGLYETKEPIIQKIENIRKQVEQNLKVKLKNGKIISNTVSIGLSFKEDMIFSIDELLKKSDIALYKAKESGRNKLVVCDK